MSIDQIILMRKKILILVDKCRLTLRREFTDEHEEVHFAYWSMSGPPSHFHCLSFFEDHHFLNGIGHVRGNFNLKTMAARVGSSPPVTAPKLRQGLACDARVG